MIQILQESSTRVKTGLVLLLGILIVGYIDSFFVIWLLFGGLLAIALQESMRLFKMQSNALFAFVGVVWFFAYFYPKPEDLVFVVAVVLASIVAYSQKLDRKIFLPLIYPTVSFLFLLTLYNEFAMQALLWLLVVVACADVGAYFVGKSLGKTQFCQTSPNKTWEGVLGGVILATILGSFFALEGLEFWHGVSISVVVAFASVFGDLFESYLKREAGVKDSGDILPGHGGILDRTDGYLFGGIVMVVLLRAFV